MRINLKIRKKENKMENELIENGVVEVSRCMIKESLPTILPIAGAIAGVVIIGFIGMKVWRKHKAKVNIPVTVEELD